MCGIAGISLKNEFVDPKSLKKATALLHHRGPDSSNTYISPDQKTGLGHTRLSFLDLSESGSQPMTSKDGKFTVVLNGEIYNYIELREELIKLGYSFNTTTDTEVLIHGYKEWGNNLFDELVGMFALGIFDLENNKIALVRDRFGIKPLYFYLSPTHFSFASEIKSILELVPQSKKIRQESVSLFLANRYVPTPFTIWKDIFKSAPGYITTIDLNSFEPTEELYVTVPLHHGPLSNSSDFSRDYQRRLIKSVELHLRSDVPIGSFLSGGMDSSTLVYMMQKELNYTTQAFSIGFENWDQSEDQFAKMVADATGAKLLTAKPKELHLESVEKLMWHFDDPIADISIIPTFEVSKLASQHVKAVVSGEGADESLGGYWWHKQENYKFKFAVSRLLNKLSLGPLGFEDIKFHYIHAMSMGLFDHQELKQALTGEFAKAIPDDPFSHFDAYRADELSVLKQLQILDIKTFMMDLILPKIDRASMANSLEVRVPFLHHPLVMQAFLYPERGYYKKGEQKPILKNYLSGKVPEVIYNRPKQGFVGPDKYYMNMEVYRTSLTHGRLVSDGVINSSYIEAKLAEKDHWRLWKLFVLENWWKNWM